MMSSLMPSEKYSCWGSSLMLANGRTAMERAGGGAWAAWRWSKRSGRAASPMKPRTSARKASQALSLASPFQWASSAVWVSSNMIGRSQASMITGTSVPRRSAMVASALTQRESTERGDHSTTTALASLSAFSVTLS